MKNFQWHSRNCFGLPIYLWLVIFFGFVLNTLTLYPGHNWGDDFAQYLIYARNLILFRPLSSGIALDLDVFPPPLTSFILAPVLLFRGWDWVALKFPIVVLWYAGVVGLYRLLSWIDAANAARVAVLLAFSCNFFIFKQNILSDVPFFCWMTWTLFWLGRYAAQPRQSNLWAVLLFGLAAMLTRTIGVFLMSALALSAWVVLRDRRMTVLCLLVIVIGLFLNAFLVGYSPGDIGYVLGNLDFSSSFQGGQEALRAWLMLAVYDGFLVRQSWIGLVLGIFLIIVFLWYRNVFVKSMRTSTLSFVSGLFFIGVFLWGVIYPHPFSVFARYWWPVFGLSLFYTFRLLSLSGSRLASWLGQALFFVVLICNLANIILSRFNRQDDLVRPEARELFLWARHHLSPDIPAFAFSARSFSLMTGRPFVTLTNRRSLRSSIQRYSPRYLIVFADVVREGQDGVYVEGYYAQAVLQRFEQESISLRLVWYNNRYLVFKLMEKEINPVNMAQALEKLPEY